VVDTSGETRNAYVILAIKPQCEMDNMYSNFQ